MSQPQTKEPSSTMIYVSNLPFSTNDEGLATLFKDFDVKTAYIATRKGGRSKGFGFVNLTNANDQKNAIEKVDGVELEGRKLIAKVAYNDTRRNERGELKEEFKNKPIERESQTPSETAVYVSNLPWKFKNEDLQGIFEGLNVKSASVARNGRRSKGFGFVEFTTKEEQEKALKFDQKVIDERTISVKVSLGYRGPLKRKPKRRQMGGRRNQGGRNQGGRNNNQKRRPPTENTLYVSNLPFNLDDDDVNHIFKEFNVKNAHVAKRRDGRSKGFAFVEFNNKQDQNNALEALDQSEVNQRTIRVNVATGVSKRNNSGFRGNRNFQRRPRRNNENREKSTVLVYVANLPFSVDDEKLKDVFKGYNVTKAYIAKRRDGRSKGFGFVEFSSAEEQKKALSLDKQELEGRTLLIQPAHKVEKQEEESK